MPTLIEWTDETWNPIIGCSRTSPGCDHCYAIGVVHRQMSPQHVGLTVKPDGGRTDWTGEVRPAGEAKLSEPLRWRKPRKVFVNSLSDLFHPDLPDEEIAKVFAVMALAPQHTFQVLTKRPQRMAALLADALWQGGVRIAAGARGGPERISFPLPNVWLGTSIESDRYTFRADHLRATPAAVRWISAEPLLGPLPSLDLTGIDWVVVGGESGPGARPMHPDWARDLRDRCVCTGARNCRAHRHTFGCYAETRREHTDRPTAFLFKQWGDWTGAGSWKGPDHHLAVDGTLYQPGEPAPDTPDLVAIHRWGKKAAGRELDRRTWDEYPT